MPVDLLDLGVERLVAFLIDELVDQQARAQRAVHAVVGVARLLPGFHVLAVLVPEIARQLAHAGVEQVGVFEHLVVEIILGGEAQRARLDAHVDVLGHQDDLRALDAASCRCLTTPMIWLSALPLGSGAGRLAVDRLGLQEQPSGGGLVAVCCQRDAVVDVALRRG